MVEFEFRLVSGEPLVFQAGQFISLRLGSEENGAAILRSYSLASEPGQNRFSLLVKVMESGVASNWFRQLKIGDTAPFSGPLGYFVLDQERRGDIVFAVTSVGIAPVRSMLAELLARPPTAKVHLFWGNRTESDLFWLDQLNKWREQHAQFQLELVLSQPSPTWQGRRGHIGPILLEKFSGFEDPTFYLVGNGRMIREVKQSLIERGVDRKRQIRNEVFFD